MVAKQYLDTLEVTIADSFVVSQNKTEEGHGEAKLYVGQRTSAHIKDFFGEPGFKANFQFKKNDLIRFLNEIKPEYFNPSFNYRNKDDFRSLWEERMKLVVSLPEEINFEVEDQDHLAGPRCYLNSIDINYQLLRTLPLPNTSRLRILKIKIANKIIYELKLVPDFDGYSNKPAEIELASELEKELQTFVPRTPLHTTVEKMVKVRIGQQRFKRDVLIDCGRVCPFTNITDESLLIAGHIKPWAKSNDEEKLNPKNGLLFTPTFDRMFNNGFITFKDDTKLIISPLVSNTTARLLGIQSNMEIPIPLLGNSHKGRREFMEYHRNYVYRD
jgi:putative restriction endonuclease